MPSRFGPSSRADLIFLFILTCVSIGFLVGIAGGELLVRVIAWALETVMEQTVDQ